MESQSNITRTLEYVQQKKGNGKVYVQGLIGVAIFIVSLLVIIFIYVPYISGTKEIAAKRVAMQTEVAALDKKYKIISAYNRSDLDDGLKSARYFIPDDIRVAELATFINKNAKLYDLEVSRLGINEDRAEVKQAADSTEKEKLLGTVDDSKRVFLGRVEGPFSFRGTRDNIYKFLNFLVMGGFATNFDQVSILSSEKEDRWSVSFFTSYYYLEPVTKVEASRPLIEVQTDALKNISVDPGSAQPTPMDTVTPTATPSVTVTP